MTPADSQERLSGGYTGRVLWSTSAGNSVILIAMIVVSPLVPQIMATLEISPFEAGLALSIMWGAAGVFQYPGGRASDELSRKSVLVTSLAILVIASVILLQASRYPSLLIGTAAIGISAGLYWPSMFALATDLFTSRRGGAFGVIAGAGDLGGFLATILASYVLATVSWQLAFLPVAVLGIAVGLSHHFVNDEPYVLDSFDFQIRRTVRVLFSNRQRGLTVLSFGVFMFVYQGTTSFLPTLMRADMGFSPDLATRAFSLLFVAGIVIKPLAGSVGDRFGYARTVAGAMFIAAIGLVLFLVGVSDVGTFVGLIGFASGVAATWPTIISYVTVQLPDGSIGGDLGGVRTIGYLIGSLGSTYVGFIAEQLSYTIAFSGFILCLLAAATILFGLHRRS